MTRTSSARIAVILAVALLFAVSLTACSKTPRFDTPKPDKKAESTMPAHPGDNLHGIDVSHYSGEIDWDAVKREGVAFAFCKATKGNDWTDPRFRDNMSGMKKAGIVRGAYHLFIPEDDPEAQAENFISTVNLTEGDLPPVVDVEERPGGDQTDFVLRLYRWLQIVEEHYGVAPIIYTNCEFWDSYLGGGFGQYPLWIAEFDVPYPKIPRGWSVWTLWQCKQNVRIGGVEKAVDLNRFDGDFDRLSELTLK